jgi:maleylpyruvate isomerase
MEIDTRALDRDVAGAAGAHQRLLATLDRAVEAGVDAADPSLLPDWTIGHVVTHLARNADGHVRMLDGLAQYEGGADGRLAGIEAGAGRPLGEQVADLRRSVWALEGRWATQADWSGSARRLTDQVRVVDLPGWRWHEVELHHVDLGLGYGFDDLPAEFVRLELRRAEMTWAARRPMGLTTLPPEALAASPHRRLAWLTGRTAL